VGHNHVGFGVDASVACCVTSDASVFAKRERDIGSSPPQTAKGTAFESGFCMQIFVKV
jgi:hypothetical protein